MSSTDGITQSGDTKGGGSEGRKSKKPNAQELRLGNIAQERVRKAILEASNANTSPIVISRATLPTERIQIPSMDNEANGPATAEGLLINKMLGIAEPSTNRIATTETKSTENIRKLQAHKNSFDSPTTQSTISSISDSSVAASETSSFESDILPLSTPVMNNSRKLTEEELQVVGRALQLTVKHR